MSQAVGYDARNSKMLMHTIGFGNGAFYQTGENRFSSKYLHHMSPTQVNAIELNCRAELVDSYLAADLELFADFEYISLHTQVAGYRCSIRYRNILKDIQRLCFRLPVKNIVVHPDAVKDWQVFTEFPDLPFSIENLDNRRPFRTPQEILPLCEKYGFGFTFDLQHCFTVDCSMKLAREFHEVLGDHLVEYHLSGSDAGSHQPLFKTGNKVIIEAIERPEVPIIIESLFDKFGEENRELDYIRSTLNVTKNQ